MAILNLTPDSFSDGGHLPDMEAVLRAAELAVENGAAILDIGGESTRPGAIPVSAQEECDRVLPVIERLHQTFPTTLLSIDTRKALVAEAAIKAGASMINDVSGLMWDPALVDIAASYQTELVIMHSQGTPDVMQDNPHYDDVVNEVSTFLLEQARLAEIKGIDPAKIILDPGFGFGKTLEHNLALFKALPLLCGEWPYRVLVGCSRKQFLTLGNTDISPDQRDYLTAGSVASAVYAGVGIIRIHNVQALAPVWRWMSAVMKS